MQIAIYVTEYIITLTFHRIIFPLIDRFEVNFEIQKQAHEEKA
jgi:hypothetical protein